MILFFSKIDLFERVHMSVGRGKGRERIQTDSC